jgi:ATP-binding cassette subfamily F protein 3
MWLEDYLKGYKGAILIVSHDRYFLDKLCTSICEIERGFLTRYKGNYSAFVRLKEEAVTRQAKEYELQQKEIAKMEDYVARNLVRASTSKSAKSRIKALDKMERIDKPFSEEKHAKIRFTYAIEPPIDVLSVKGVDISVGTGEERKTLLDEINFNVRRGDKVGIIGDNGIGKSTLLKIIQEKLEHKGLVRWNSNIKISYFEQESTNLNKALTVMEELHHRYPSMSELEVRSLLAQVRLTGENVFKETGVISGGERAKLCFAIMMQEHGNVLILDEPTNHLDLASKEAIETALEEYTGTVIFVSHDRYLLSKIADRIIELRTDGAEVYEFGFEKYMDVYKERRNAERLSLEAEKRQKAEAVAKEKSVKAYKSKQQRSAEANRRNQIRQTENEIDTLQQQLDALNEEITHEEVFSDYELMNAKCTEIEELKQKIDELFDLLVELDA